MSVALRYDGVYWCHGLRGERYLRFHEDGRVCGAAAVRATTVEDVDAWLDRGERGHYICDYGRLSFTLTSPEGSVDYTGNVLGDALVLHIQDHSTGQHGVETYELVSAAPAGTRAIDAEGVMRAELHRLADRVPASEVSVALRMMATLLQGSHQQPGPSRHRSYECSFCGKGQAEVRRLIAGPGAVYICDECVNLCREIIDEEEIPAASRVRG